MYKELAIAQSLCGSVAELLDDRFPGIYDDAYDQLVDGVTRYSREDFVSCTDADLSGLLRTAMESLTKKFPLPRDLTQLVKECRALFNDYDESGN